MEESYDPLTTESLTQQVENLAILGPQCSVTETWGEDRRGTTGYAGWDCDRGDED